MAILGVCIAMIWRKAGLLLATFCLLPLLLFSLPVVSAGLVNTLQNDLPISPTQLRQTIAEAEAVVLLAGGRQKLAGEYGDDTVNTFSLVRSRYAARILKQTRLPLIISGGSVHNEDRSEADLIRELLQKEFNFVGEYQLEEKSRTTYENAKFTAELLKQRGMQKVLLVTHAWHMPRAKSAFEYFDIQIIPAPTAFYGRHMSYEVNDFLPSLHALMFSGLAFHEIFGNWWYEVRYYTES